MLSNIKKWLKHRRDDQAQKEYERGYGWASVQLMIYKKNPDTLCPDSIDRNEFDKGAQRACFDIGCLLEQVRVRSGKIRRELK